MGSLFYLWVTDFIWTILLLSGTNYFNMVEVLTHTIMFRHLLVWRPLACSKSTYFKFWTVSLPAGPPRHAWIVLEFSRSVSLEEGGGHLSFTVAVKHVISKTHPPIAAIWLAINRINSQNSCIERPRRIFSVFFFFWQERNLFLQWRKVPIIEFT